MNWLAIEEIVITLTFAAILLFLIAWTTKE